MVVPFVERQHFKFYLLTSRQVITYDNVKFKFEHAEILQ